MKNRKLKCIFFPWDVLSFGTFCPLGHFVSWDVLSLGTFCPWDILSLGPYVWGRFVLGRFVPWDILSWDVLSVHPLDHMVRHIIVHGWHWWLKVRKMTCGWHWLTNRTGMSWRTTTAAITKITNVLFSQGKVTLLAWKQGWEFAHSLILLKSNKRLWAIRSSRSW